MKKLSILALFFLLILVEVTEAARRRGQGGINRGLDDSDDEDDESPFYGRPNMFNRRKNKEEVTVNEILDILEEVKKDLEKTPDDAELLGKKRKYQDLLDQRAFKEADFLHAFKQGFSRGMRGQGCTASETVPTIVAEAVAHKFFAPMGKVISQRGLTFWEKVFDGVEGLGTTILHIFGLVPTISANDVLRWQASCASLADNYKDLRKSIETSESRTTSMQLRSLLQDDTDDEEVEEKEQIVLVDPIWEQKRRSDLILLESIVLKLKIKKYETSSSELDIHAAIDWLQSNLEGLIDQLNSALALHDLIDSKRAQMMVSYFAMIDAGLTELGMIIAPDQFDATRSRRKKGSSYGYGYYSD